MIEFSFKYALKSAIGENGLEEMEIRSLENDLVQARRNLNELRRNGDIGFYNEIGDAGMVASVKETADRLFSKDFNTLYVFGMGGSSLGAIFLKEASGGIFRESYNNENINEKAGENGGGFHKKVNVIFSENIDPCYIHKNMQNIDIKKTLFCFVSKSADTIEVVSQFFIVKEMLENAVKNYKDNLLFITDKKSGFLRQYADENGIATLDIAKNVGGRYSIVTAGTLFPAYVMGLNIDKFLHGAISYRDNILNKGVFENNPVYSLAAIIYLYYKQKKRNIFIINAYSDYLREYSRWFRQLFAESLGKDLTSPTPVPAAGATDQHSQLQLYMQGPQDKLIGFFCLKNFCKDYIINPSGFEEYGYLKGKKLSELLLNELTGVELALATLGRPSFRVTIDKIDEFTLGELSFMSMEMVPILGMLLKINPFDQPGVEKGKKFAYLLMGRKDESMSKELEELNRLNNIPDLTY
ncbi:MAG: glucose-6-phosphate isomerase [Deltaproteobacteria bacterium]|jgi:glucose-6-phosphate isomerase|nr:glucose-6-phosphate isomerase [Deltaproteobacteria bacterium]MCL5880296.1 glucose-6-phosphate isomerase [Deltaproteobacteria bacterium]MDA8303970.1 glucose-6-phosphate isomerase [Deltaproteobacteria bacterium]